MNTNTNLTLVDPKSIVTSLTGSGERSFRFRPGDTVVIAKNAPVYSRVFTGDRDNKESDKSTPVYYLEVTLNGNPAKIPFASFRKFPTENSDEFSQKTPAMSDLYCGDDADRYHILQGKTLKCTSLEECETRDWSAWRQDHASTKTKKEKFPVLDYVK